ncbi:MAG: BLUF domain-containing protein [Pseudomonadota bacterium]
MQFRDHDPQPRELIGCLTYQSVASKPPSDVELDDLVTKARARNNSVGVTGMLLYEDGKFLQTLEGPPAGLEEIWASIRQDERHANIEVLTEHLVPGRLFSNWDLLLYRRRDQAPPGLWNMLRRKHRLSRYVGTASRLAFDANEAKLNDLLANIVAKGWTGDEVVSQLLEPAARTLGDAWLADECSEFDLTMALVMLQTAGHAVRYSRDPDELRAGTYNVLLATAPGEPHMFSTSLLADQLVDAGWGVEVAFPTSDEALENQLLHQQPDAVDIALSDALSRPSRITHLRETVRRSRTVLSDQPLVVSVGGRLFAEAAATAEHVGADHARHSASGTRVRLGELIAHARTVSKPT